MVSEQSKLPATTQRDRFIAKAGELKCDEDEDRFNATLKRITPKPGETASVKPTGDQQHDPPD